VSVVQVKVKGYDYIGCVESGTNPSKENPSSTGLTELPPMSRMKSEENLL